MSEKRPYAAFTLASIGFAIQLIIAVFVISALYFFRVWGYKFWHMMPWFMYSFSGIALFLIIYIAAIIILGAVGLSLLNSSDISKVRNGSILIIIAGIIALPTMLGFFIGSLLMVIGGILGLVWQPS